MPTHHYPELSEHNLKKQREHQLKHQHKENICQNKEVFSPELTVYDYQQQNTMHLVIRSRH